MLTVSAINLQLICYLLIMDSDVANSLSLLGDAAAMSIDVFTYGGNLYAEYVKGSELSPMKKVLSQIAIPVFSLFCLLAVTIWVAIDAYLRLRRSKEVAVALNLMYIFATINFCVDVCCIVLFFYRRNVFFEKSNHTRLPFSDDDWSVHEDSESAVCMTDIHAVENTKLVRDNGTDIPCEMDHASDEPNLNMMSAITHVGGDTLRTVAVLAAAVVSSLFDIDPQITDAWAGIAVSITIVIAVTPLVYSVKQSVQLMWT